MTSTGERRKMNLYPPILYRYHFGKGIVEDLKQRLPYYLSDFFDGFVGEKTLQVKIKQIKCVSFLMLSLTLLTTSLAISLTLCVLHYV